MHYENKQKTDLHQRVIISNTYTRNKMLLRSAFSVLGHFLNKKVYLTPFTESKYAVYAYAVVKTSLENIC